MTPALDQALIYFNGKRHPREMGQAEVTGFLNHLAGARLLRAPDIPQQNAWIPVIARPRMSAWMSCVPS
jgi:hypothetical protein